MTVPAILSVPESAQEPYFQLVSGPVFMNRRKLVAYPELLAVAHKFAVQSSSWINSRGGSRRGDSGSGCRCGRIGCGRDRGSRGSQAPEFYRD